MMVFNKNSLEDIVVYLLVFVILSILSSFILFYLGK